MVGFCALTSQQRRRAARAKENIGKPSKSRIPEATDYSGVRVFFYLENREPTLDSTDKITLSFRTLADELVDHHWAQRSTFERARAEGADLLLRVTAARWPSKQQKSHDASCERLVRLGLW
jgi:hypothetical protein